MCRADTTVEVTTYPDAGAGHGRRSSGYRHATDVTLFLHTAELRELRDLLTDTLTTLSAATDSATDPTGADGRDDRPGGLTAPPRPKRRELIGPTP